jgi:hypothetical protein
MTHKTQSGSHKYTSILFQEGRIHEGSRTLAFSVKSHSRSKKSAEKKITAKEKSKTKNGKLAILSR